MTLAQADGPELPQQPATLWDAFQKVVLEYPDHIAIRCFSQCPGDLAWVSPAPVATTVGPPLELTYLQLNRAAEALAKGLARSGLKRGSVLAVFCTGGTAEWAALFWACLRLGAKFAPLNARLVDRPEELRHVLELLQPSGIVTLDGHTAGPLFERFSDLGQFEGVKFRLHNRFEQEIQSLPNEWQEISILGQPGTPPNYAENQSSRNSSQLALILLTSGTTAMPKAAAHTHTNLLSETAMYLDGRKFSAESTVMMISPVFHILGVWSILMAWRAGATVLVPAMGFDAAASVGAFNNYAVTHLSCSPTVIDTLISHPEFSSSGYRSLEVLGIGADRVDENLLRKCGAFGATKIINGWGMTEGIGVLSYAFSEDMPWRGDKLSIGHVMPGSAIKVCSVGSTEVVARGEIGELHVSGCSVVNGYYDRGHMVRGKSFHEADGKTWFATGDAVIMDDNGYVYITGRYKDLIIRGGENVHPGLIERCINPLENVKSAQVFGMDDGHFGQSICAVLQINSPERYPGRLESEVQQAVTSQLGPSFRLAHIYTLTELGLNQFPATATGKIRKAELAGLVHAMVGERMPSQSSGNDSTLDDVLGIWTRLCGPGASKVSPETDVAQIVDSLVILRFCSQIEKHLGKQISPVDVLNNNTPAAQARLLNERSAAGSSQSEAATIDPASIASTDPSWLKDDGKATIAKTLDSLRLDKTDLEAVYEPHDYMSVLMCGATTPSSNNMRWIFRSAADVSVETLRDCLYKHLRDHANMRSVVVPLQTDTITPYHAHLAIKPTEKWLGMIVREQDAVQTEQDLTNLLRSRELSFATMNGPAVQMEIIPVQGCQRPGLMVTINHAVFDALSVGGFFEDLNATLKGKYVSTQKIPYHVFAEMYRLNKGNALSRASDDYYVKFMQEIDDIEKYSWPKLRGPSPLFIAGDDEGWKEIDNNEPVNPKQQRVSLDEQAGIQRGVPILQSAHFEHLHEMKVKHGIGAYTLVKAAIAIFNIEQTGMDHAYFANNEAGRTWPFVDQWTAQHLPSIMKLAGPTFAASLDFMRILPTDIPFDLLKRIAEKQRLDTLHCHASWDNVRQRLGKSRAQFRLDVTRQWTNWDGSSQSRADKEAKALQILGRAGWVDVGAFWNFGQPRPGQIEAFFFSDDVHLSRVEAQEALDRVFAILHWLTDPSHLQSPLEEILIRKSADSVV